MLRAQRNKRRDFSAGNDVAWFISNSRLSFQLRRVRS
jgi:hypothetical protein